MPRILIFFSSHVFTFEKIGTVKSHCMNTKYHYPSKKTCWLWRFSQLRQPTSRVPPPTHHSLKCFFTLIGLQRPNPQWTDGWMDGWIIIAYNEYYSCVYSFMWVCVCVCVNECIVWEGGGWPSCVIVRNWLLKILRVPTTHRSSFGWLLIKSQVASFFFLRPIGGRDLFLQTFQKDGKNFFLNIYF